MYLCVYCICVCVCGVSVGSGVCVVYECISLCVYAWECLYPFVYVCAHAWCMYVCACTCVYMCLSVYYIYMYICVCVYVVCLWACVCVVHTLSIYWEEGQQWPCLLCPVWFSCWPSSDGWLYAVNTRQAAAEPISSALLSFPEFSGTCYPLIWAQVPDCLGERIQTDSKERRDKKTRVGTWLLREGP